MRRSPFPPVEASDHTCMKNGKVRNALADHGDDGSTVRHVMHYLFVEKGAQCTEAEMAEELRLHGFEVDLSKCKDGVIAEEYREVASSDFDSVSQALTDLAISRGWKYDGFECAIEVSPKPSLVQKALNGVGIGRLFGR